MSIAAARTALGVTLAGVALLGHVLAARAIGGSYVAYRDHLIGFVAILLVSALVAAAAGRWVWQGRAGVPILVSGILQAAGGVLAYLTRYSVHG
jgi:hypothetical protein